MAEEKWCPIYKTDEWFLMEIHGLSDVEEIYVKNGWKCDEILSPFFYKVTKNSDSFVEIKEYTHEKHGFIIELWNYYTQICCFLCKTREHELEMLERLVSLAKNLTIIEKNLKQLVENEQD